MRERFKNLIHRGLKSRGSITQPKGHHSKLVMSMVCFERSFAHVLIPHQILMVSL